MLSGSAASVPSLGPVIRSKAYEKHRIKRSDRILSNANLLRETPHIYSVIYYLFCARKSPVIAVDGSDLNGYRRELLLHADDGQRESDDALSRVALQQNQGNTSHHQSVSGDVTCHVACELFVNYFHRCQLKIALVS